MRPPRVIRLNFTRTLFLLSLFYSVTSGDGDPEAHGDGDQVTNPPVASKENTFKEFYIKAESERSKSTNPSMEEIIGGIMQLIGNNVKLNKPLNKPALPPNLSDQDLLNHGIRLANRNPATFASAVNGLQLSLLPSVYHSSVLIGPPPPGMPLPLSPYNSGSSLKVSKPSPYLPLSGNGKAPLRIPESNITGILDHKLKPQMINSHQAAFDPLNRVPSNKILPKPSSPHVHDRDIAAGSQLHPEFTAPNGNSGVSSASGSSFPRLPYHLPPFSASPSSSLPPPPPSTLNVGVNSEKQHSVPSQGSSDASHSLLIPPPYAVPGDVPSVPLLRPSAPSSSFSTPIDHHHSSLSHESPSLHSHAVERTTAIAFTPTIDKVTAHQVTKHRHTPASSSSVDAVSTASLSPSSEHDDNVGDATKHVDTSETDHETDSPVDVTDWLPLGQASLLKPSKTWSEAPPIIITQEDPSVFDITIRHKIGANGDTSFKVTVPSSSITSTAQHIKITKTQTIDTTVATTTATSSLLHSSSSTPVIANNLDDRYKKTLPPVIRSSLPDLSTAVTSGSVTSSTHIDKSAARATIHSSSDSDNLSIDITPTAVSTSSATAAPTQTAAASSDNGDLVATKTRKSSILSKSKVDLLDDDLSSSPLDDDVVYGKPHEANRPIAPSIPDITLTASGVLGTQKIATNRPTALIQKSQYTPPIASVSPVGKPFVVPVDVDEVKPKAGTALGTSQVVVTDPGQGSVYIDGRPTHFKIRPAPTLQVGSGVTVKASPHDSSSGGRVLTIPRPLATSPSSSSSSSSSSPSSSSSKSVRRPPFRLRPSVPLVRIDTCIVGDDSTCEVKMNERCKTELGISSCQCRPGFGRSTARGMCNPIISLGVALKLDKLDEKKLTYTTKYANSNSEEYQFLEYECIQGFNSIFSLSRLAKVFMGVRVNRFFSAGGKMLVNASIDLELNNITKVPTIKRIVQQELSRVIALRNNNIGDSSLWVDASANSIPRVDDINECLNNELNDCSSNAFCINEFGSFRCLCKKGFEDRWATDPKKSGRHCSSCSPSYCSNRGECHIVNGEKECKCRGNFIGSKCDIDVEVLGVAVGGSVAALVIIVITFLCLYMWNQKWKVEQQKIEAMSAASAQTFSYMNKNPQQQATTGYRYAIDDRFRWTAPVNEANFYASPEQVLASSQLHHVYATPSRVQTPDALITSEDVFEPRLNQYTSSRPSRSKSRNSLIAAHPYQTNTIGAGSIFNETEFSTRETMYTPSHIVMTSPRTKYALYS